MSRIDISKILRAPGGNRSLFGARAVLRECAAFQSKKPSLVRFLLGRWFPSFRKPTAETRA